VSVGAPLVALVLQLPGAAQQGPGPQAVVETDRGEYVAGDTVAVTASGFSPFETVTLQIVHADGTAEAGMGHEVAAAAAGPDGTFSAVWSIRIADITGADFLTRATGAVSGQVETAFTRVALIETDKIDYQPGETAVISGSGFAPLETVTLQVTQGGDVTHGGNLPFAATSDEQGNLSATWFVDPVDSFGKKFLLTAEGGLSGAGASWTFWDAGSVSLAALDVAYTQDFNTLAITGTTNVALPLGWDISESGGGSRDNEQYAAGTGSDNTGDTYSFGAVSNTERAFGGLQSGTLIPIIGAWFTNNTGATITSLDVEYTGEQWRIGNNAAVRDDRLDFQYSLDATSLTTGTWTNVVGLNFANPTKTAASAGALDGNASANRIAVSGSVSGLSIPNGGTFWIRWTDLNATGADDSLGVDDFSMTPHGAVAQPDLSIDDVSLGEGDGGNSAFTFTVSLSEPAPTGGVTFDIATGDGMATTADNDYVAKTLLAQTIPQGSDSYMFTVEVNGDVNIEPDETFFVNVTNVTGANVVDGQGQGTIVNDEAAPTLSITDVSANEGTGGLTTFTFTVNLSTPALEGGVTFDIATADGSAMAISGDYVTQALMGQTIAEGAMDYSFQVAVNSDTTAEPNEAFFVNVTDVNGAIVGDGAATGTILNDDVTRIRDIQGASHISPVSNQPVLSVTGIVTALRTVGTTRGFYLQDSLPDANDATSEGIFVFTGSTSNPAAMVSVGNSILVSGMVSEFRQGGASSANLTVTEIVGPLAIVTQSMSNPLPAAIVIGAGGRMPPATVIDDDATGSVETGGSFDPATDGIDFYESLEGMRVQLNDAVAVGPISDFGSNREIPVVADAGINAGVRTARGGVVIQATDFNPERVFLNDWIAGGPTLPAANVGDSFPGATVGFIDYSFGNFKLQVASMPSLQSGGLPKESTAPAGVNQLAAATFNVENLDPGDPASKFATLATMIVSNLKSPDIVALEEVQDNNGATNNGVTDATATYNTLIGAIQAAGGPLYQFRQIDPVNNQDGGEPGGNIRQAFLFRTDRGLAFVDRPGGTSTNATGVTGSGELTFSPGRLDPSNAAFTNSRKPLAGEFTFNGRRLFVIANHFNSKGGDEPLFGRFQPPNAVSEVQRHQQAQVVHDFVAALMAADPNADVIVLGDLNDFQFSDTMEILRGTPSILSPLIDTLPMEERYSYVFEGNSQALDHILVSSHLATRPFAYDILHVNSEFAAQASDHDPQVVQLTFHPLLTSVGPAKLWVGLKNSDAVGLRLDVLAELLVNDVVVATGVVTNVAAGSSGFNNALHHSIPMSIVGGTAEVPFGASVALRASVRRTCFGTGHNSGTPRLWFNGQPVDSGAQRDAGSRVAATIGATAGTYFLRSGSVLSTTSGSPKQSVDISVNSNMACPARPYSLFGTWTTTVP
jgi:predicted extracellular nuclease